MAKYAYDAWGKCTIVEDTSECGIATINPYRYRSYYYDPEIGMYYLQSRYYDPVVGRFVNGDVPEVIGLSIYGSNILGINLCLYCLNNPATDSDLAGHLSAKQAANMMNASTIFFMFVAALLANYTKALTTIGVYITKVITPPVVKALWWKPLLAAAIIVAAVAIVVAAVAIIYSNREQEIENAKKRIPKKLMKNGKVDLSQFNKKLKGGQGKGGPDKWRIVKDFASHAGKAWKLYHEMERIASLLEDGTIYGK